MFPKNLGFFQPWLTVRILHFHAITGLPHTHALCMTQDVVRYVKMPSGSQVRDVPEIILRWGGWRQFFDFSIPGTCGKAQTPTPE